MRDNLQDIVSKIVTVQRKLELRLDKAELLTYVIPLKIKLVGDTRYTSLIY